MEIVIQNLLSPPVLFFILGVFAALVKSDLKLPDSLKETLSIYLLIAIGLKGGIELAKYSIDDIYRPVLGGIFLGAIIPVIIFIFLSFTRISLPNKVAIAACYGSVSIVTYGAAVAILETNGIAYEGYMNAVVVLMESPAIFVAIALYQLSKVQASNKVPTGALSIVSESNSAYAHVIRESLFGKSVLLLTASLVIGYFVTEKQLPALELVFIDAYKGVLVLFLLGMGLTAGEKMKDIQKFGAILLVLGIVFPVLLGLLGIGVGAVLGLSEGSTILLGVLAGSASYIAAPAAIQSSVPEASPSIYLTMALAITFPFNLIIGIPLYMSIVSVL